MNSDVSQLAHAAVDAAYRNESRRVLSMLIRLLGDFDLAEDAMQEAFSAALQQWPRDGVPANPRAWLVSTGRFKAIDAIRRRARSDASLSELAERLDAEAAVDSEDDSAIQDDRLRLIFICCHPLLSNEAQIALTLREACGLKTEEIARAFLTAPTTLAQRIVRAKARIRETGITYEEPEQQELPQRLASVLRVAYLVFNEGYYSSSGVAVTNQSLSEEAIRLGRLIVELLPNSETLGLLGLMLFQESRREARMTASGDLILLEDQDRSLWNHEMIEEGLAFLQRAVDIGDFGPYLLQASIASVHATALNSAATDWSKIVRLYDLIAGLHPSPIVALNRAVAVAMRDGPEAGLALIEAILKENDLSDYGLAYSAHADLCRRLGRNREARESYQRALELAVQEPERRFLERRLRELPF